MEFAAHLTQALLAIAIIVDASLAFYILAKDPRKPSHQAYFLIVVFISLWQISNYLSTYVIQYPSSLYAFTVKFAFVVAAFLVATVLYFAFIFPNRKHHPRLALLLFIVGAPFAFISIGNGVSSYAPIVGAHARDFIFGPLYSIYIGYMLAMVVFVLGMLL